MNKDNITEKTEQVVEQTSLVLNEMRLIFDAMAEIHKNECLEMEQLHTAEIQSMQKNFKVIILALAGLSAVCLIIFALAVFCIFQGR